MELLAQIEEFLDYVYVKSERQEVEDIYNFVIFRIKEIGKLLGGAYLEGKAGICKEESR